MAGGSRIVLAAYASCMRKNGEPNFPDPNAQGQLSFGSANGIDPSSPQFQQAQTACRKLLPNHGTPTPAEQAQARAQALAFSACMRKNGVPNFPDPQFGSGGRVSIRFSAGTGLDPQSPQFQAAQNVCQKDVPGKFGPGAGPAPGSKCSKPAHPGQFHRGPSTKPGPVRGTIPGSRRLDERSSPPSLGAAGGQARRVRIVAAPRTPFIESLEPL